ncbi:MAG: restriction endonuclease, SacI family [Chloroflexi bacterium]|nr:restriction endonuclease, SacI family [Chloroflexota bacterium]
MASIHVSHDLAKEILLEAFRGNCSRSDEITQAIRVILEGSHKTYKYILVTGILAKASSDDANPLALQAKSTLPGAYDARSLCHKVLIPFERDFLNKVLGGSNEPFLNKPARYPELSSDNAVRKGKDKETLLLLIKLLSSIKASRDAQEYLACVFSVLKKQIKNKASEFKGIQSYAPELIQIYEFSLKFVRQSHEGETLAILVGTLESLLHKFLNKDFDVITHKVNQSGASSKEVGDIDVFDGNKYLYSIEVKDKDFNEYDLDHAFDKIFKNGGNRAAFIYGFQASFDKVQVLAEIKKFENDGHFVLLQDIETFIKSTLFRLPVISRSDFANLLIQTSETVTSKDATKNWIKMLFADLDWT